MILSALTRVAGFSSRAGIGLISEVAVGVFDEERPGWQFTVS
jgi:hypothetical protein